MKNSWLLILCVSIFISCSRNYTTNPDILSAERMLNTHPDSSFLILSNMRHPEKMGDADYAAWCLNYTHAQYKLHKPNLSDSLIKTSIEYYTQGKDKRHAGIAYYLTGCIYRVNKKNKEAMIAFKNAENLLENTGEYRISGLVQFNMGYICMYDELYNHSLKYFQKSLRYSTLANDFKTSAYAYREISDMYNQLNYPFDSVMLYSNKALKLAQGAGDSLNYYTILTRQGELLYNKNYRLSKDNILNGFRHLQLNLPYYASYLAYIYTKLNMPDSARYYLAISYNDSKQNPDAFLGFVSGALIYKNNGKYQQAYNLLEKAYAKRDSVYQRNIKSQLYRIDKQYDLSEKEKENSELTIANQRKLIWISFLGFIVLLAVFIILQILNWNKKTKLVQDKKVQALEFEKEAAKTKNKQKREIIRLNLNYKIENTLRLNRLKKGILQQDTKDTFIKEITHQSILTENVWKDYIENVNKLFDNGITSLKETYSDLSYLDQMVIALICLNVNVKDSCSLLSMEKNTMYVRRKTIKKRLGLDAETDLEEWIVAYVSE